MSELYHGIVYLRKAYADQLPNLPDELEKFIIFYAEILKSPDATTISRSQQTVFNVLHELNPNFEHEVVEVRSIDFYNRHTEPPLAGFYNGPSHDLYREGKPCALNSATILCQKTLELLGIEVVHLPSREWEAATTIEAQRALLTNTIPRIMNYAVPLSDAGSNIDTSKSWSEVAGKKRPTVNYNPRYFQYASLETAAEPATYQPQERPH